MRSFKSVIGLLVTGLLVAGVTTALAVQPAAADPVAQSTVTQDALPTVQINGVVWQQVTVGTTVYAVGNFTSARPAGSPAGTNETPRTDILAYDITTGNLIASFNHTLNGQVQAIAASPDGTRIYIGGQFTAVDGANHYRLAAFDTGTGGLVSSFDPSANAAVSAITATNSTVYFGGNFGVVDGNTRTRLAAVTSAGDLTAWAPTTNSTVNALLVSPNGAKVIAGGSFDTLNGVTAQGIGALDPASGATVPWGMSTVTTNGASSSGFLTLSTDGQYVYTGGWQYNTGNFEGTAALDASTGNPVWINDCWGDTYSVFPQGGALYVSSHAHNCAPAGGFPDTSNTWHFGLAYKTVASSGYNTKDSRGWNYSAYHTSALLQWNPTFDAGSFTGTGQATWSVTGNGNYVAFGGEFPSVNGTAQQGLVRFTTHSSAPNAYGPSAIGTVTASASQSAVSVTTSAEAYDPDDGSLTYQLIRDGNTATPVATATVTTPNFWQSRPAYTMTDTTAAVGSTHTYRIRVVDGGGKTTGTNTVSVTVPATPPTNVATRGTATQSSTNSGWFSNPKASLAIDGRTDGNLNNGSVSQTQQSRNTYSWWQVDLGAAKPVVSVNVWNRTDCCGSNLSNYYVFASATPFNGSLTPAQQAAQPGVWSSHQTTAPSPNTSITLPAGTSARYVAVQLASTNVQLALAEVQVYSTG